MISLLGFVELDTRVRVGRFSHRDVCGSYGVCINNVSGYILGLLGFLGLLSLFGLFSLLSYCGVFGLDGDRDYNKSDIRKRIRSGCR